MTVDTALIAAHATSGAAAFVFGCLGLRRRLSGVPLVVRFYIVALWLMVIFLIAVVVIDWTSLTSTIRVLYAALVALAVYTGWRGWRALQDLRCQDAGRHDQYVDDVGFTLITLFDGFVIIGALDLGAPVWVVVSIGVIGILLSRRGVVWAKSRPAE